MTNEDSPRNEIERSAADREETALVEKAREGDGSAIGELIGPLQSPLFAYIYRMVAHRQDAEDIMQDVLIKMMESLPRFRGESKFKTWLFGIATHVCLDRLKEKKRWRIEAQLIGEQEADQTPGAIEQLRSTMAKPDFVFEIREHIAFCFSCIGRSLPPEEQAAIMLKEVFGFTSVEAAGMIGVSEPVFRHRLSSARASMVSAYEGLCQLINKTGRCYQCRGLREVAPESHRGPDLVRIEVAPGKVVSPDALLDERIEIARNAALGTGPMREMHDSFFSKVGGREDNV
ncbi:MAG: RNA polymerase sigma factor [Blastocatellia bacterium]